MEKHVYKLGDTTWRPDFDDEGLWNLAMTLDSSWSAEDIRKLHSGFEVNNHHDIAKPLWVIYKRVLNRNTILLEGLISSWKQMLN